MSARSSTVLSVSGLATTLLAIALVLVNVVVSRASTRIDLTEERLFSISPGTEKILANLKDPAKIRVFWGGLQAIHEPIRRTFAALLDEMADASDGRLTVRWVDVLDKAGKEEASEAKVQEFRFFSRVGDEQRQSKGYCSLVVESGAGDPQVIEALVSHVNDFEYVVATSLVRATRKNDKVLALIDGSDRGGGMMGMGGRGGRFEALKAQFKEGYGDSVQWWHTLDQPLPDNITVALVLAPQGLKDPQVFHLEQFLLRGGKAVVCVDPLNLQSVLFQAYGEGEPSGLEPWLEALGVTVGRGTAVEGDPRLRLLYLVPSGDGRYEKVKSGYWFLVLKENLDLSNPATMYLENFSIYWPAPLSYDAAKQAAAGRKVTVLASTTSEGMRTDDMTSVRAGETPPGLTKEKVPLALLIEGPIDSLWKGKPKPGEPERPADPHGSLPFAIPGSGPAKDPEAPKEPPPATPEAPKEPAPAPATPEAPKEPAPPAPEAPKEPAPKEPAPPSGEPEGPKGAPGDPPAPGPAGPAPAEPPKADEPKPDAPKADAPKEEPKPAEPPPPAAPTHLQSGNVRLVLVGDADMLSDQLGQRGYVTANLGLGLGGVAMVGNAVDWLMGDDALLSLRAKDTKPRAIERPEDAKRTLLQTLNLAGIPTLAAFAGLIVFLRRRSQR